MAVPKIFSQLYRGETRIPFVQHRRVWHIVSGLILLACLVVILLRGFNFAVAFEGGTTFRIDAASTRISTGDVNSAFLDGGVEPDGAPLEAGSGDSRTINVNTESLKPGPAQDLQETVAKTLDVSQDKISFTSIGSAWGHDTTVKAAQGLVIFLIAVTIYIGLRFQWRMAIGAMLALIFDLAITAGIYSLVGFEVSPSTIVGLLTILGFSLYDTVVVYDKVAENSRDILAGSRTTYTEAANSAVNQTLMRSINTSLIGLLPVAGLLFVGVGVLGIGTIKDLALILFVGLASGAYSSLFIATPVVVDLVERDPKYKALQRRVSAKRASDAKRAETRAATPVGASAAARSGGPAPAPKVGARPQRHQRRKR